MVDRIDEEGETEDVGEKDEFLNGVLVEAYALLVAS